MARPLVSATNLCNALGGEYGDGADGAIAAWAVRVVSDLVRSYTRLTITETNGAVLVLTGARSPRLVVGERPLRGVGSVSLDGEVLPPAEYTWLRSGVLWRGAGWGGPEVPVVVTADIGFTTVPADIRAVVETAAARLTQFGPPESEGEGGSRPLPFGFTPVERLVLDRYRRRTA